MVGDSNNNIINNDNNKNNNAIIIILCICCYNVNLDITKVTPIKIKINILYIHLIKC